MVKNLPASAGDIGSIPGWGDPTFHRAAKPMCPLSTARESPKDPIQKQRPHTAKNWYINNNNNNSVCQVQPKG